MLDEDVPADAAVLMDLVNTSDERSFMRHGVAHAGGDDLIRAADATHWLRDHGLISQTARISSAELGRLRALRDALRDVLAAGTGHADAAALSALNATLAGLPLAVRLDSDGTPRLVATSPGVIGRLSEVIARMAADGSWHRLRMCAATDCRWVFYDTSRNARGRWCSMQVCGNRDKTRRYRERHASPSRP